MKTIVYAVLILVILFTCGCVKNNSETSLNDYNRVNKTYPVETVIYGTAYGTNFTEVRYNNNGYGESVSDISANTVDFHRVNEIAIQYIDGNKSYLTHEYQSTVYQYPIGIYTLHLSRETNVGGTTCEFNSGRHTEQTSTTVVYEKK